MIIENGEIVYNNDNRVKRISRNNFEVYYVGFIFISGLKNGEESIDSILIDIRAGKSINFSSIYGNYFLFIIDKLENKKIIFIDNSGVFKLYKYKNSFSTSFIELIDFYKELSSDDLQEESILQIFQFGFTYFEDTIIKSIKKLDADNYYIIDKQIIEKRKPQNTITDIPKITFETFFKDLIYALSENNVVQDLTGGIDSRLILSYFYKERFNCEYSISGLNNNKDVHIAQNLSEKLGLDFYKSIHTTENFNDKTLLDVLLITDGQIDIVEFHRNYQLQNERLKRNIDLYISGAGGELYKDFWWLHEFPFYNRKRTDLEKLYQLRILNTNYSDKIFSSNIKDKSLQLKENFFIKFKKLLLDSNTKSLDNIYYNFKMKTNVGTYISASNYFFKSYAPLLECELVKIGFNLRRRDRFFNNFHRKLISENSYKIAEYRTTEGTTVSSLFFYKVVDLFSYTLNKLKRFIKLLLRKYLHKTYLQENPTNSKVYYFAKESNLFKESFNKLKDLNIIAPNISTNDISNWEIGKILTLGLLIKRMDKRNS